MNHKVKFLDANLRKMFGEYFSYFATIFGVCMVFINEKPLKENIHYPIGFIILSIIAYILLWFWVSHWKNIDINVESTTISIITGDIFE